LVDLDSQSYSILYSILKIDRNCSKFSDLACYGNFFLSGT